MFPVLLGICGYTSAILKGIVLSLCLFPNSWHSFTVIFINKQPLSLLLAGVFRGSPALWAGSSDTSQEINLNYRDAPPCRREASLVLLYKIITE
jgi:hypothetical protein